MQIYEDYAMPNEKFIAREPFGWWERKYENLGARVRLEPCEKMK